MKVMTLGSFDMPHFGHANLLKWCHEIAGGEYVIVGLNTDEFIERYKGRAPIMDYWERRSGILAFGSNVRIIPNESAGRDAINTWSPDILVIGSDWARKDYLAQIDVTQDWLDERGISVMYCPYTQGISTTELKRRIHEN